VFSLQKKERNTVKIKDKNFDFITLILWCKIRPQSNPGQKKSALQQ
jgi:hypothetical protein